MRIRHATSPLLLAALTLPCMTSCMEGNAQPEALRVTRPTGGPRVAFDLEERPFPEIPFPNDIATRPDPTSPTGKRVNISQIGGIDAEQRVRKELNRQTGFGVYSPISVSFDAPLDLYTIIDRHQELVPSFENDVVYLVNIDQESPWFGELVLLDMGRGNFPINLDEPERYFLNDSHVDGTNLFFETRLEEDTNKDSIFGPLEDLDDDLVQDIPNLLDPLADPLAQGQLLTFYERETRTLILRPVIPLRPATTYAVVLTRGLTGEGGLPIESPFSGINHTRQTADLEALRKVLPDKLPARFDTTLDTIQFTWSFTTRTPTAELEAIRAGLYGHGTFAWLKDAYPAKIELIHDAQAGRTDNPMIFNVDKIIELLAPLISEASGSASGVAINKTFEDVDYVISGSFISPHFLVDHDGLAERIPTADEIEPGDHQAIDRLVMHEENEAFDLNINSGFAITRKDEVPFLCVVPKPTPAQQAPFPTIIYSHAIGSTRFEALAFSGAMAKFGMATCTIDAVGHGVAIPPEFDGLLATLTKRLKLDNFPAILAHSRGLDLNGDGAVDSGGDYFSTDLLHSRDNFRQSTVDQLQLVRLLRSFDGSSRFDEVDENSPFVAARRDLIAGFDANSDGVTELRGDFNGDGVVDLGGDVSYVSWGTSLGGIHTTLLAGIEPSVKAVASNAGGGGMLDIAGRTSIANVRVGALLRTFGPLLVGRPVTQGDETLTQLSFILPNVIRAQEVPIARVPALEDGDVVVLRNRARESSELVKDDELYSNARVRHQRFRTSIATDATPLAARRTLQGITDPLDVLTEVASCAIARACGEQECPDDHACNGADECTPVTTCLEDFDASQTLALAAQEAHIVRDPARYGDKLAIEIYDANNNLKHTITTFELNALYGGLLYPKGAPLASLVEGWGMARQTPQFRRFWQIGQMLLEPADPAVFAMGYARQPLKFPYETAVNQTSRTNALIVGTLGDQTVPIDSGLALARATGALEFMREDPRYGMTPNQYLVHEHVYEGIADLDRHPAYQNMLFDPDDLDRGQWRSERDGRSSPETDAPLRSTFRTPQGGLLALRLPYLDERGEHTFNAPNPSLSFDIHTFMLNQVGWFLANGGTQLSDDVCLEADVSMEGCAFFDPETFTPSFEP